MLKEKLSSIIERLQSGDPLSKICKDKDMPAVTTVYSWMRDDEELKKQVMDARQLGAWSLIDQMNEQLMSDNIKPQDVQLLRERMHQSRWLASKLLVGTFGDKIQADVKSDSKLTIAWSAEPVAEVK
jgi:signal transduction protein with GAF and PtsI domain